MTNYGKNIRVWLRDALAMEEQAEQLFSGHIYRLKDYLSPCQRLELEVDQIKRHQTLLSTRIQQLGSARSTIKDFAARLIAGTQNVATMLTSDEPVVGIHTLHTFTQAAIGSYKILIAAAEVADDTATKQVCLDVLGHTEVRAAWLAEELTGVTKKFLLKSA
jgi:ferritin-like metal-binding protein YciE